LRGRPQNIRRRGDDRIRLGKLDARENGVAVRRWRPQVVADGEQHPGLVPGGVEEIGPGTADSTHQQDQPKPPPEYVPEVFKRHWFTFRAGGGPAPEGKGKVRAAGADRTAT